jgi:hypothetical protein
MGWLLVVNNITILIFLLLCYSMASDSHRIAWFTSSESNTYDLCKKFMGLILLSKDALESMKKLNTLLMCGTVVQTRVQRKGMPNPLSQDTLREEGTTWLINFPRQANLSNVGYFNMLLHVWQLLAKYLFNRREKKAHHRKEPTLIPCKNSLAQSHFQKTPWKRRENYDL